MATTSNHVTEVTDSTLASMLQSELPVLVKFWAEWCGPCRAFAPVVESVAQEFDGKLKAVSVNIDENPQTAQQYGVQSIPTTLIIKQGQVVERFVGGQSQAALTEKVSAHV
ncbi:MAG: thioredoxin [Candidatus Melainabacteria bacterium]|nr:thioredoxin [Candidatus Melainabacteria bacterium]